MLDPVFPPKDEIFLHIIFLVQTLQQYNTYNKSRKNNLKMCTPNQTTVKQWKIFNSNLSKESSKLIKFIMKQWNTKLVQVGRTQFS